LRRWRLGILRQSKRRIGLGWLRRCRVSSWSILLWGTRLDRLLRMHGTAKK